MPDSCSSFLGPPRGIRTAFKEGVVSIWTQYPFAGFEFSWAAKSSFNFIRMLRILSSVIEWFFCSTEGCIEVSAPAVKESPVIPTKKLFNIMFSLFSCKFYYHLFFIVNSFL